MRNPSLSDLLGGMIMEMPSEETRKSNDFNVTIDPEAQIMELALIARRIEAGNPFRLNDIVTPREGYNTKGVGNPHIVIGLREPTAMWSAKEQNDSSGQGRMADMRVMTYVNNDNIGTFWVESYQYEAYKK